MTQAELTEVLNATFRKWTAEIVGVAMVEIHVRGWITAYQVLRLEDARPCGTHFRYKTMGFWENLFTLRNGWK